MLYIYYICQLDIHLKIKAVTTLSLTFEDLIKLDIHLKIKAVTTCRLVGSHLVQLDIHLKIKAVTTYKLELDEFQLYIIKIK